MQVSVVIVTPPISASGELRAGRFSSVGRGHQSLLMITLSVALKHAE